MDNLQTPVGEPILVIDMGGTNIKFGYSCNGQPLDFRKLFSTDALRTGDPIRALALMVEDVVAETAITPQTIVVAIPGFIDTDGDRILHAANIRSLDGRRLGDELGGRMGCTVLLERDSILALMGETRAGVAQGADHVLGVFFGTGVGAAFMTDGKPFRGSGWALEIGLMPFLAEGPVPEGVRPDCLEAHASGRALQAIAGRHGVPIDSIFLASGHSPLLADDLSRFIRHQAMAVGMAGAMVSPATILLGGGVMDMVGYPRETLIGLIEDHLPLSETGRRFDLRWSRHGWAAVLHGAPAVVTEHRGRASAQSRVIGTVGVSSS
ncbi:ROK family protein [Paraburkholderia largidicola]|uniref:Sugar kinase n=1 Tax=Paraburkholderia largidicola TaxID=3014751 RepID=A0A7I8C010_9BURK|nr:ROK family protein [Paraburkholderia sp. PGU16]BCF93778.1 sugar kinase [Paraburkholderia sp. PGU16]